MSEKVWETTIVDDRELDMFDHKILRTVEEKMQLKLPQDYVDLMKTRNGGSLARTIFKLNEEEVSVEYLLGIGKSENEGVLTTLYMSEEWDLPKNIVLLSGDGHSWVFLDYRVDKDNPSVSYIDTEIDVDVVIASDFTDFINGLSSGPSIDEIEYVSENVYSMKEFEKIVKEGDDAFLITDGVLYFTEVDCDMEWLMSQVTLMMDIDTDESEFILPEALYFLMNKIPTVNLNVNESAALRLLAKKVKDHQLTDVNKYYKKVMNYVK